MIAPQPETTAEIEGLDVVLKARRPLLVMFDITMLPAAPALNCESAAAGALKMPPVKVLTPLSVRVPKPLLTRTPAPEITPDSVWLAELGEVAGECAGVSDNARIVATVQLAKSSDSKDSPEVSNRTGECIGAGKVEFAQGRDLGFAWLRRRRRQ